MALQERGMRTRRLILEAAADVFAENGYEGASTTAILAKTGLTRGALYHHFPSKEAIADALVATQAEAMVAPERTIRLQSIIDLTLSYARELQDDPLLQASVRLTVEQTSFSEGKKLAYQQSADVVRNIVRDAESRGELIPGADPEDTSQLIIAAFTGVHLMSQLNTERKDLMHRVSVMWRCLLPGIATPGLLTRLTTRLEPCGEPGLSD
ncbi:ScbR family autoregulator-binding transcription factor [Streptomyces sp. NPDC001985]|uniref:ScbR family autoregulator-binding transcription factor n=1 Tax=Streptomyces sp. NPDC001985 TaxID=3154406 RepID=UPI00332E0FCA